MIRTLVFTAAAALLAGQALAQGLEGPPTPHHGRAGEAQPAGRHGRDGECYAKVRFGPQFGPPPSGPEYVWRRAPPPPGAPGPIWCLTVQPLPDRPVLIAPERYGWVRVLCDQDAAPDRIARVQRRLHDRGLYQGQIDGRYDVATAHAVRRFQLERRIEDRGYLSYRTLEALEYPPPPPPAYRSRLTTFETGYIAWPGKVRF